MTGNGQTERRVDFKEMHTMVKQIHIAIYGSNGDGLKVKVARNENNIKWIWRIVGGTITALFAVVFAYIRKYI